VYVCAVENGVRLSLRINNICIGVESFSNVFCSAASVLMFYLEVLLVFSVEQVTVWHFQCCGSEVRGSAEQQQILCQMQQLHFPVLYFFLENGIFFSRVPDT